MQKVAILQNPQYFSQQV